MKNLILVALGVACAVPSLAAPGGARHGGGAVRYTPSHPSYNPAPSYHPAPSYRPAPATPVYRPAPVYRPTVPAPVYRPSTPVVTRPYSPIVTRPSRPVPVVVHNGNIVTPAHGTRIGYVNTRVGTVMRGDFRVVNVVQPHVTIYQNRYMPIFRTQVGVYHNHYARWGSAYRPWYRHGFHGGFYYPLVPVYAIHEYFYSPLVFWLWCDSFDEHYYHTWYGSEFYSYPELRAPFFRPGVFYPTVAMRDLSLSVAGMPVREQINFRAGLEKLVRDLEARLALGLGRNDIVINHYQMLDQAVVVEGFVSSLERQLPFKALFDLNNFNANILFTPAAWGGEPTEEQLLELRLLNERIAYYGGQISYEETPVEPGAVIVEPAPVPVVVAPAPVVVAPAPVVVAPAPVVVAPAPVVVRPAPVVVRPVPVVVYSPRRGD